MNSLLRHGCNWKWTPECTKAFKASKDLILSAKVLARYDPMLPLKLAADASAYGLRAVISQFFLIDWSNLLLLHPGHSYLVSATRLKLRRRHWLKCLGCSISTSTFMVVSLHL